MKSTTYTFRLTEDEREHLRELAEELSRRSGINITPAKTIKRAVHEFGKSLAKDESLW